MTRLNINGSLIDSEKESSRCIEKIWEYIEVYLEPQINRLESQSDSPEIDMLTNRIEDLELELSKLQKKVKK